MERQLKELIEFHKGLSFERLDEQWNVWGEITFLYQNIQGRDIRGCYEIEIDVPFNFPYALPTVRETGGKITRISDNHIYSDTGELCLGTNIACLMSSIRSKTLVNFVNEQVVPHLAGYSFFIKFGYWPHGELSHGDKGVVEFYTDYFGVKNHNVVIVMLKMALEGKNAFPDKASQCVCNSGKSFGVCHFDLVLGLSKPVLVPELKRDIASYMRDLNQKPKLSPVSLAINKLVTINEKI